MLCRYLCLVALESSICDLRLHSCEVQPAITDCTPEMSLNRHNPCEVRPVRGMTPVLTCGLSACGAGCVSHGVYHTCDVDGLA